MIVFLPLLTSNPLWLCIVPDWPPCKGLGFAYRIIPTRFCWDSMTCELLGLDSTTCYGFLILFYARNWNPWVMHHSWFKIVKIMYVCIWKSMLLMWVCSTFKQESDIGWNAQKWCDNNFYGCYTPIEPYIPYKRQMLYFGMLTDHKFCQVLVHSFSILMSVTYRPAYPWDIHCCDFSRQIWVYWKQESRPFVWYGVIWCLCRHRRLSLVF